MNRTIINTDSGKLIGTGKTKHSNRPIGFGKDLARILKDYKFDIEDSTLLFHQRYVKDTDWFFTYFNAHSGFDFKRPFNPQSLSQGWRRAIRSMGIEEPIRFHDLRHFHAVTLLRNGISIKQIQTRLGHSTSNITMDVYMRYLPADMEDTVAEMSDMMFK
jgi:integrase